MDKSKPRIWPVIICFISTYVLSILLMSVLVFSAYPGGSSNSDAAVEWADTTPWVSRTCVAITGVIYLCAAIAGGLTSRIPIRKRLQLRWPRISALELLLFCSGSVAFGIIPLAVLGLGIGHPSESLQADEILFQGLSGTQFALAVVLTGLLTGIAEELLFRGYIQTRFCERWGTKWGILWTSLLFGLVHYDPPMIIWATCVGAYYGILTQRTKSVVPTVVCHSIHNILLSLVSLQDVKWLGPLNFFLIIVSLLVISASLRRILRMADRCSSPGEVETGGD